jgi:hypothetical protein
LSGTHPATERLSERERTLILAILATLVSGLPGALFLLVIVHEFPMNNWRVRRT